MKRLYTKIMGVVTFMVFLVPMAYGGEAEDPTAMLLLEQGEQLVTENQMEGALASFDLAIQVDPGLSKAYLQASAVASQLGKNEKAISYLEELGRREPNNMQAKSLLADLAAKTDQGNLFGFASSGFFEFGIAALLGLAFLFVVGWHEFGEPPPRETEATLVERPYFIYPLLKVIRQGNQRELLAVHEKRHRSLQWQPRLAPVQA
jgi:tetratricopeptide (TPR) repeat protein